MKMVLGLSGQRSVANLVKDKGVSVLNVDELTYAGSD